ncbi:uncharacterized protein LOC129775019 [Toxorhynchites rutilus septentrionalis]|uniref:uncharacterized protein LOC129775019 n=1 Tax=Toxorhynchites rutilus septentrionalis TaxID=329112 RepID=UPI002478A62B|nr:uncharacterized protein LOC129775019 [Toxorhynchites rutilus septentrionalis]
MSNFLQLRRPTTYSRLQQSIPKPPQALPSHGALPQWENLGIDQKLSAMGCPIHPSAFSRGRLSQPIWTKPQDYGFDLTDPLCRDVSYRYLILHDKNLAGFYKDKRVRTLLKYHRLMNDRGEIICSLMEFNRFRAYLWKLHKHEIRKEFQKLDRIWWQEYNNKKAALHIKKYYDFENKIRRKQCIARELKEAKKRKAIEQIAKYHHRLQKFLECRENKKQSNLVDGHLRALKVRYNHALMNASKNSYRLRLKRRLRERDNYRARRLAIIKKRIREAKKIMSKERHKMLFIAAQETEAQRQEMLKNFTEQTHRNIKERTMKYAQQQERFERQLTHRKAQNLSNKYEKRSKSALMRAMLKTWNNIRLRQPGMGEQQLSLLSVENAVNAAYNIHATISPTMSSTQVIDTARQLLNDMVHMPSEQLPLDEQTVKYTSKALLEIVEQIKKVVIVAGCSMIEQVAVKMRKQMKQDDSQRRPSLCGPWTRRRSSGQSRTESERHRVSIGDIQVVDEIQTDQEHFKKTRNRPPTPVTSVTSLVHHLVDSDDDSSEVFEQLEIPSAITARIERRATEEDHPLIHLTHRQRRFLETNLMKLKAIVHQNMETRTLAAFDVMQLKIIRRKLQRPIQKKEDLAMETARVILVFPKEDQKYASLLLDIINMLAWEACDELENIINKP